ncbi:MAG: hypothetical protein KatS3mg082_3385 [Nitrospiraceae bacterium]|nr:MAG: hypothetical protein KatS3mg082_3385 [Nitrospiraceae bacterium]
MDHTFGCRLLHFWEEELHTLVATSAVRLRHDVNIHGGYALCVANARGFTRLLRLVPAPTVAALEHDKKIALHNNIRAFYQQNKHKIEAELTEMFKDCHDISNFVTYDNAQDPSHVRSSEFNASNAIRQLDKFMSASDPLQNIQTLRDCPIWNVLFAVPVKFQYAVDPTHSLFIPMKVKRHAHYGEERSFCDRLIYAINLLFDLTNFVPVTRIEDICGHIATLLDSGRAPSAASYPVHEIELICRIRLGVDIKTEDLFAILRVVALGKGADNKPRIEDLLRLCTHAFPVLAHCTIRHGEPPSTGTKKKSEKYVEVAWNELLEKFRSQDAGRLSSADLTAAIKKRYGTSWDATQLARRLKEKHQPVEVQLPDGTMKKVSYEIVERDEETGRNIRGFVLIWKSQRS